MSTGSDTTGTSAKASLPERLAALLVEDSAADAKLIERQLGRAGFEVSAERVETADELRTALAAGGWDIVLCDHVIPGMDSTVALELLTELSPGTPLIVVSGAIGEEAAVVALQSGAADYVNKGNLERLGTAVRHSLHEFEARRAQREAEAKSTRLAAIVESSHDAIIGKTLDGTIVDWNQGAEALYGYTAAETVGKPVSMLVPEDLTDELAGILERVGHGESVDRYETVRLAKGGRRVEVSLKVSPVKDADGKVTGASTIARDITERKRLESRLQYLADHDVVTGLYNRRRFEQELDREISYATRYQRPAGLLLLDIDNFKYINDSLGHGAGDEVIRGVGALLKERLRESDILARVGGDEFAVVVPQVSHQEARATARGLQEALRRHAFFIGGQRLVVTTSIGVALLEDELTAEELMVNADLAMYEAKETGRDRVAVYSAAQGRTAQMEARLTWMERIRSAMDEGEFSLFSQPILEISSGEVSQREILLRMAGADGDSILPGAFLGPAERFGLIQELDRWVVRESIRLIAAQRQAGQPLRLEVNLSAKSINEQTELISVIGTELSETGIDPADLIFEMTETSAISNMEEAIAFAKTLGRMGCGFALDDFGAGFGSFSYLKYLPVNYIKIDGEFIRDLASNPTDQILVKSMVDVAAGLGMETIAEFVEDQETLDMLGDYGVDFAQGFHIARPAPVSTLASA